jgi:hypothetical protein
MARLNSRIHEVIVTTVDVAGNPHSSPMGISEVNGHFLIKPFKPSSTYDNLKRHRQCTISYIDDVRIISGALTGRRDWPVTAAQQIDGFYLTDALAHTELEITDCDDADPRASFSGQVVFEATHAPFRGFNRAQNAVVELAILVSRIDWLPQEKIKQELSYLMIAMEKTAGDREWQAWHWLMEKVLAAGIEVAND